MTIIQPNKNKGFIKFLFLVLGVIFIGGGFYIFEYNDFVNVRHERNNLKKAVVESHALNADLKNRFYTVVDPANLETVAFQNNLIIQKTPEYLKD